MFNNIKGIFSKFTGSEEEQEDDEYSINLSYSPVPLTIALRKRKFEEEQLAKYGIVKEKMCDIL